MTQTLYKLLKITEEKCHIRIRLSLFLDSGQVVSCQPQQPRSLVKNP